jgi:carbon monoxide dehydrogenase subunit G
MITVDRHSYIEHATPEEVFEALSDPTRIEQLLPRMRKVEIKSRQANQAHLVTHMSLGGIFGTIPCEGNLHWVEPHEIIFKVKTPLPLQTRWTLSPAVNGTDLQATMSMDLRPMLGPMAAFVPTDAVVDMVGKELDHALTEMSHRLSASVLREQAVAA